MTKTYPLSPSAFLYHADARDALRALPADSIDSCVTDPPYALVSIVKRFGGANAAPAKDYSGDVVHPSATGAYMRASAGLHWKKLHNSVDSQQLKVQIAAYETE